jgi:hypothetical protein
MKSNVWPPPSPAPVYAPMPGSHTGMTFNYTPCGLTWPCWDEPQIPHLCRWGSGHLLDHKCQCGAEVPR